MRNPPLALSAGISLVLLLSGCAGSTPRFAAHSDTGAPTGSVLDGRIVFTRAGGEYGDETIFIANADGSWQRRLTPAGEHCCVRVARDGRRVLFSATTDDGRITTAIMNLADRRVRALPLRGNLNFGPGSWSPNGSRIAVEVWDEGDPGASGIYLVRSADGGGLKRLTTVRKTATHIPGDFSPDGKWLAYLNAGDTPSVGQLFIVPVDGSTPPKRLSPRDFRVGYGSIRFSPDGRRILFNDGRDSPRGALWTVRPDGKGLVKVFDHDELFASHATWSPDGDQIMFAMHPIADDHAHPPNGLYVIDTDGDNLRQVLGGDDHKREPEWFDRRPR